jgi:ATPase family associated with various cellular activities (AAA)
VSVGAVATAEVELPRDLDDYRELVVTRMVRQLGTLAPTWLPTLLTELRRTEPRIRTTGLCPVARLAPWDAMLLVAAGLIETDIRFGSLFATMQDPLPARRPCVGLLAWLLSGELDPAERAERAGLLADGSEGDDPHAVQTPADLHARAQELRRRGLLVVDNPADPRTEWVVSVPVWVWDVLERGAVVPASLPPGLMLLGPESFPNLDQVEVAGDLAERLTVVPDLLADPDDPRRARDNGCSAVVLRGMEGSGRLTVLGAAAKENGESVLLLDEPPNGPSWSAFAALSQLGGVQPVIRVRTPPGESVLVPELRGVRRPIGIVADRSGGVGGPLLERAVTFTLDPVQLPQRRRLWAGGSAVRARWGPTTQEHLATTQLLTPGGIVRVRELAGVAAAADGGRPVELGDVRSATEALQRQALETVATRLAPLDSGSAPLLNSAAADELATLVARCRTRELLAAAAGRATASSLNRGVRAMFTGPSGTGKTLTARHLGAVLGREVYRVDLSAVVDKYIGETERNLDQVLSRAEELDVVLLLDEGDSLMTRRTEVGNSNDRYANLQTNFLLQRLETFEGIVVVTTNAGHRIDQAFLRRIDVTVDFAPPDADLRWQLWNSHLPVAHDVNAAFLDEAARRCALTGGQIRNAALHATMLALDAHRPVSTQDCDAALQREYRRSGSSYPLVRS